MYIHQYALLSIFFFAYTIILLSAFLFVPKWYSEVVAPIQLILLFLLLLEQLSVDHFCNNFGINISLFVGILFTWKTTAALTALLTIMYTIQVLITGNMVDAFGTALK